MFRSMSICPESMSSIERSRSPSPVDRSETPSHVLSPRIRRRLEDLAETPPPREPEPVQPEPVVKPVNVAGKKKIMAPPMQYDLHKADAAFVYIHIKVLTENDVVATEYLEQIKPAMFANQRPIVFGYIPAPPVEHIVKQVIGAKGYFFKMTTVVCGVYFIWHEMETNTFLFWGPSIFKTVKAMNSIRWRIFKYYEKYGNGKSESNKQEEADSNDAVEEDDDDDDYADMPKLISSGNTPDYEHPEQN